MVDVGAICTEMLGLYQADGIIAEPAGALATAALAHDRPRRAARVGCLVSGGNNDVSRYAEVIERSLVHEGLRHYFLVTFPQEPGALRGFLDHVLADGEDIVVFEYVKKSNRETGPALIGIDLDSAAGLAALVARMAASNLTIEKIPSRLAALRVPAPGPAPEAAAHTAIGPCRSKWAEGIWSAEGGGDDGVGAFPHGLVPAVAVEIGGGVAGVDRGDAYLGQGLGVLVRDHVQRGLRRLVDHPGHAVLVAAWGRC